MTCFYCGTELPDGAMFCGECGRPVNTKGGRSPKGGRSASQRRAAAQPVAEEPAPTEVAQPLEEPAPAPAPEESVAEEPAPLEEPTRADEPAPVGQAAAAEEPVAVEEPAVDEAAAVEEPVPADPEPRAAAHDATAAAERCAQCGAPLAASDIFCPECGFVRQRVAARARPSDTNILDPFPWGLPRPTNPVAPETAGQFEPDAPQRSGAQDASAAQFADAADVAETRLVPRGPRGERFVLQFSTGESVSVSGSGLIGRNPIAEPGEYFDTLVAVVDPGRSVSKTHLEFGQDGPWFWVSDRYSGNGTVVREPDREPRRCEAGKRYRVARGARVEIGEQFFIVS